MRSKQISSSTKKTLLSDKQLVGKKPTIVKCFICNQMFYSQQTFDSHMDHHQKKVTKNFPDQIQRKTLQSFGLKRRQSMNKKNTTLQAINPNEFNDNLIMSKTQKIPTIRGQKIQKTMANKLKQTTSTFAKRPSYRQDKNPIKLQNKTQIVSKKQVQDKDIEQINEAIRQSSLMMSQFAFLTQNSSPDDDFLHQQQVQSQQQQEKMQKTIEQSQFINFIKNSNPSLQVMQQKFLQVIFNTKTLQNYQLQLQHLIKLKKLSKDAISLEKINRIRGKVFSEVLKTIVDAKQVTCQKQIQDEEQIVRQEQNAEMRNCSGCYGDIMFGELVVIKGRSSFHKDCFE